MDLCQKLSGGTSSLGGGTSSLGGGASPLGGGASPLGGGASPLGGGASPLGGGRLLRHWVVHSVIGYYGCASFRCIGRVVIRLGGGLKHCTCARGQDGRKN